MSVVSYYLSVSESFVSFIVQDHENETKGFSSITIIIISCVAGFLVLIVACVIVYIIRSRNQSEDESFSEYIEDNPAEGNRSLYIIEDDINSYMSTSYEKQRQLFENQYFSARIPLNQDENNFNNEDEHFINQEEF